MFAVRSLRAPLARVTLRAAPVARFSAISVRFGGHHEVKINQGPGAAPGTTPTDLDQSTGLERAELLGKMQGKDIFDLAPLEVHVRGTKANPTIIHSRDPIRYCGNVYKWTPYEADENYPENIPKGHHH
ncbi:Cytochrome c oxidase subunit 4 [Mortierella sp. AD032]|nr:Cytochrome c oxidase subunit 4 [Mortierella sp. AD032]